MSHPAQKFKMNFELLEENIGKIFLNIGIGNAFLNKAPIVQVIRARIDK
jgi:uncharacterized membrane protein